MPDWLFFGTLFLFAILIIVLGFLSCRSARSDDSPVVRVDDIPVLTTYMGTKLSLWEGDMTKLKIDAIVNAANTRMLGGGGIDGAIHRAAGPELYKECLTLNGCSTGYTKITKGYNIPAKHILHTVGPIGENPDALSSCYSTSLDVAVENNVSSVCFCCISTGIYGYPNHKAAGVALDTVREWLDVPAHRGCIDRIVFCTFMPRDAALYGQALPLLFSAGGEDDGGSSASPDLSASSSASPGESNKSD
jgi:O-acetyl-ADP-ribose deacetylase (regulator of RNase III)